MLESGLYFVLGFLAATLLILMLAPAIWRRAVTLTRKQIESSIPLTVNEIQADKDQLRAEHAMNTRRLEVTLEQTKQQNAEQLIEININREKFNQLEAEKNESTIHVAELETRASSLQTNLTANEIQLNQTAKDLTNIQGQFDEKSLAFSNLDDKYQGAIDDFDGQKIEMVARETRLDTIETEARETNKKLKSKTSDEKSHLAELKSLTVALNKESVRNIKLNEKLTRLQSLQADMEGRLERRDKDLAKLRDQTEEGESENSDDNSAPSDKTLKKLQTALQRAESERDTLKVELGTLQISSSSKGSSKNDENAMVRERISEIAARLTAMTAQTEGADSPINKALAKKTKTKAKPTGSLADRIRALQSASEKA